MSMADIIMKMPCWYVIIIILFSLFYAVRGIIGEQDRFKENTWSLKEKIISFLFKNSFLKSSSPHQVLWRCISRIIFSHL